MPRLRVSGNCKRWHIPQQERRYPEVRVQGLRKEVQQEPRFREDAGEPGGDYDGYATLLFGGKPSEYPESSQIAGGQGLPCRYPQVDSEVYRSYGQVSRWLHASSLGHLESG